MSGGGLLVEEIGPVVETVLFHRRFDGVYLGVVGVELLQVVARVLGGRQARKLAAQALMVNKHAATRFGKRELNRVVVDHYVADSTARRRGSAAWGAQVSDRC
ncbi:MAG: hypothetical protein R2856_22985 [Caldilineaceae bacterium]